MLRPIRLVAFLFILLFLGCAHRTAADLKQYSAGKYSFEAAQNYQPVYRVILEQSRACFQGSGIFFPANEIEADIYHDIKAGNINVHQHNFPFGVITWTAIDISALGDNNTRVEIYFAYEDGEPAARAIEQWVKAGFKGCRFPE